MYSRVSGCSPQQTHISDPLPTLLLITSLTGKIFCSPLHIKCLSLCFILRPYRNFHTSVPCSFLLLLSCCTPTPVLSCCNSLATIYPVLTDYSPFLLYGHISLSFPPYKLNGIARILLQSALLNNPFTSARFHSPFCINSFTN